MTPRVIIGPVGAAHRTINRIILDSVTGAPPSRSSPTSTSASLLGLLDHQPWSHRLLHPASCRRRPRERAARAPWWCCSPRRSVPTVELHRVTYPRDTVAPMASPPWPFTDDPPKASPPLPPLPTLIGPLSVTGPSAVVPTVDRTGVHRLNAPRTGRRAPARVLLTEEEASPPSRVHPTVTHHPQDHSVALMASPPWLCSYGSDRRGVTAVAAVSADVHSGATVGGYCTTRRGPTGHRTRAWSPTPPRIGRRAPACGRCSPRKKRPRTDEVAGPDLDHYPQHQPSAPLAPPPGP